jgi:hypothetical protein
MRRWFPVVLVSALIASACGNKSGTRGPQDPNAPYDHGSDGTLNDASVNGTDDLRGLNPQTPFGGFFRFGINGGYPNPAFDDQDLAELETRVGCNSQRISLPETHLARWGWDIEVADLTAYQGLGLSGQVGFLTSPTREHSAAPATSADWKLAYYIPKNLYEPVLNDRGEVNADNYWAAYVYQTVSMYKDFIKVWEIWNEPDWVADYARVEQWATRAPVASDLPRFNGSIFDYVRMLRVSKVAAQLADPDAKIATGGIGYPEFLSALLRYTDNPVDDTPTDKFPSTGTAYVDVLSFHHYPIFTVGNSDAAVAGYFEQVQAFLSLLTAHAANIVAWENTETGAPHASVSANPGGEPYARNYLLKVMVKAQAYGIDGIDWFTLADAASPDATDDPYDLMGLYRPVATLNDTQEASTTTTGVAFATLGRLLSKARYDLAATQALALPVGVEGDAFITSGGKRALVLWATTPDESEAATATVVSQGTWVEHDWDWSSTNTTTAHAAGTNMGLTSTPSIFLEP